MTPRNHKELVHDIAYSMSLGTVTERDIMNTYELRENWASLLWHQARAVWFREIMGRWG